MEWKQTDPRIDIYKRSGIVILRPGLNGQLVAGVGNVETSLFNELVIFKRGRNIVAVVNNPHLKMRACEKEI